MIHLTKHFKIYLISGIIWIILFNLTYHWLHNAGYYKYLTLCIIFFAGIIMVLGAILGLLDKESKIDHGFRYHLLTYILGNHYWLYFLIKGLPSFWEKHLLKLILISVLWGISLLVHFIGSRKGTIKGIPKGEIFEW